MSRSLIQSILILFFLILCPWFTPVYAGDAGYPPIAGGGQPPESPTDPNCEKDCTKNNSQDGEGGCQPAGDPVSLYSGKWFYSYTDLNVNGVMPIQMVRKYDNQMRYDSPLGYGWAFTYDRRIYKYPDGSVIVRRNCGVRDKYVYTGGAYVTPAGARTTLIEDAGGFTVTYPSGRQEFYDLEGKLTAIQDARSNRLEMSYDVGGRLPLTGSSPYAVDPNVPTIVAYDYRLIKIEERTADGVLSGNSVTINHNSTTGRVTSITASDGRSVSYVHDETLTSKNGNLLTVNGLEGLVSTFTYIDLNDAHNISSIQVGADTTPYVNTYDTQDRVITQTHGNDVLTFAYTIPLLQTTLTHTIRNADNTATLHTAITVYDFTDDGYVTKITNALGHETRYTYYPSMWVQRREIWQKPDAVSSVVLLQATDYTYDTAGNKLTETVTLDSGEIITITWAYDHNRIESKQTVSSLNPTKIFRTEYTFYYDSNGNPTNIREKKRRKDDGSFLTTTYDYDAKGRLTSTTLPDSTKIINLYEGGSQYVTKTYYEVGGNPIPQRTQTYGYDANGNRNQIRDAYNNLTQIDHDSKGRALKITNPLFEETHYTYTGNKLTQIERGRTVADGEGQITSLIYNTEEKLQAVQRKDDAGIFDTFTSYTYDSAGNRLSSTDGENRTTTYTYDSLNQLKTVTDPLSKVTQYDYDAAGNRTNVIDPMLNETKYSYDDLNRLNQTEQLGITPSAVSQFSYDTVGNLLTVTDPENNTTTYEYDALSRKTKEIKPLSQQLQYFYDSRDRLDYMLNARGHKIDYNYFEWGPVDTIQYYANDTTTTIDKTVTYTYDNNGNLTGTTDDSIQAGNLYTYTYDTVNRADVTTIQYLPGGDRTLDNDYDRYGNRSTLTIQTDNSGTWVTDAIYSYQHNKLNQLTTATLIDPSAFTFSYYNTDDINTITYPSGVTSTHTYQSNGPVQSITSTGTAGTLATFGYTYDDNLNVDTMTDNDGLHDFSYDGIDHLTQALHPAPTGLPAENYVYDKVGNRENPVDALLYNYDQNNRITKSPAITSYTYDDDGNTLTESDGSTYTYNKQNRLSTYAKDTANSVYQYGPFGRRITKTVNGTTTWYLWDGSNLIAEYDNAGSQQKLYAYLASSYAPAQIKDGNGTYNVHANHLNTPRLLTDSTQTIVWKQAQEAFGKAVVNDDPDTNSIPITFNTRFPGQYYDAETGLHYNYFRYYDPEAGRYLTSDPIGLDGGLNTYGYVGGNPLKFVDPHGLWVIPVARGIYFTGLGIATAIGITGTQDALNQNSDAWDGSPRPGIIPGTTESLGPIDIPSGSNCPNKPPNPKDCGDVMRNVLKSCVDNGGGAVKCHAIALAAFFICIGGNDFGDGGDPPSNPDLPPGYYSR